MSTKENRSILLVEDETLIALAQAQVIRSFGYTVLIAGSGEKAVEIARGEKQPDLILMDIDLGKGISGPDAAAQILSCVNVPIVFLTSHAEREMVETVRGITRYGYIVKNSGDFVLQSSIEMAFELFASSQRLKAELAERERAEAALDLQNLRLMQLNTFALGLAALPSRNDIHEFIAKTLKDITGAYVVAFSRYDPVNRALRTTNLEIDPGILEKVTRLLGKRIQDFEFRVSDEIYQQITANIIGYRQTLAEMSFGTISPMVGAAIQTLTGMDRFIGIASCLGGELYATCMLAFKAGEPVPTPEFLESCANMVAVSLRRKRVEDALRETDLRYRSLIESSNDVIFCVDEKGEYRFTNHVFASTFGKTPDFFIGKTFWDVYSREQADIRYAAITRVFKTGEFETLEVDVPLPDRTLHFLAKIYPIKDELGHVLLALTYSTDITARKKAEDALKMSESKFSKAFQASPAALSITSLEEGRFIEVNDLFLAITGFSRDNIIGHTTLELGFYVDPEERRNLVEEISARGSVRNVEIRYRMKDGEVRHILVSSEVLEFEGRRCSLNFLVDITERKRIEQALVASQQITQDIINAIPARVFWKGKDLTYLGCNKIFAADAGFSRPMDLIGKDDFAMGWREQAELYRADDRQVMESGLPKLLIEEPQTTPDGKEITILTSKIPLKGSGGDVIGILGIYLDITARKKAEEEIRALSRFPDENPNPVLRVEENGKVLYANHASEPLLRSWGCTSGEYLPSDWRQTIVHAVHNGTTDTVEVACDMQFYSVMIVPIPGTGYVNVYGRDITDSKRTEELIERRIAALTQPLDGGAITFDDLFNAAEIQRIQDEFSSATGVASIITHPDGTPLTTPSNFTFLCSEIIRKTERGCANCFRSDAAIGRYRPDGPLVQTCLSGGLWDAGASIVVGNRHVANWLIGQVRDETQSEEHMRAYAREIGADEDSFMRAFHDVPAMSREKFDQIARVLFTLAGQLSRTAYQNLQQARFITEREHADEKIRTLLTEKELLLKEVHHRIKNNMNTMMSLLSLQAGSVKDAGSVVALTDARRRLQSMMVLYDRLYRSDGFRELSIREYLTPLVHEIVGNFPNKDAVNIETHLDDIVLDSKTLAPIGIVVNELLTNAMKHAFVGDRGGSIRISASLGENRARIAVHDDGIGLPASLDVGTSTGFGLRLVGMLAEQLGGTVRIEREHGTRFTLEFEV